MSELRNQTFSNTSDTQQENPDERQGLSRLATAFIGALSRLLKAVLLYGTKNLVSETAALECAQTIKANLDSEGLLALRIDNRSFYYNNRRIPYALNSYSLFMWLLEEMLKRCVGRLEFHEDASISSLLEFSRLFLELELNNSGNYLFLRQQFDALDIRGIEVNQVEELTGEKEESDVSELSSKQVTRNMYNRTFTVARELMEEAHTKKFINIRKAKHLIQNVVDEMATDESTMLGLASIKNYDKDTYNHSVNVTFYSLAIGQRLGLKKAQLSFLGLAALFHDYGKTLLPLDLINKPDKLTPEEWDLMRTHSRVGAEHLLRMKTWGDLTARIVTVAYEHHRKFDLTGYPAFTRARSISLFSRIVSLADYYDALGRARVYRNVAYGMEKTLGIILEESGKSFDPALVKVFINIIGIHPLGSLVELDTGEKGVVMRIPEDSSMLDRPLVCLFEFEGGVCRKGELVDLREKDGSTGEYKYTIVKSLNPNDYHFNLLDFFL